MAETRVARNYDDELGMVVMPPPLDCIGESCPVAAREKRCHISRHHGYFPRAFFVLDELGATDVSRAFWRHKFNTVSMARCSHDIYHRQIRKTLRPPDEVMAEFLREAQILDRLGVVLEALDKIHYAMTTDDERHAAKDIGRITERLEEMHEESGVLQARVGIFEVVPTRAVERAIGAWSGMPADPDLVLQ